MSDPFVGLRRVLTEAVDQDAGGKGVERHSDGVEAFEDQQICQLNRWIGTSAIGGPVFQICKKALEASRLSPERAIRELRGSIVYASAAIILLEEKLDLAKKRATTQSTDTTHGVCNSKYCARCGPE